MRLRTNAKVNLFLGVRRKRADGFHEIETVFQSVDLADILEITDHPSGLDVKMSGLLGSTAELPQGSSNIVTRALKALAEVSGREACARVEIAKRIPIAAGLAGGSANAAGALLAANRMWSTAFGSEALSEVAASLGSDVPFCLVGGTAFATGRGERLRAIGSPPGLHLVLGISPETLSTADVYAAFDRLGGGGAVDTDFLTTLGSHDVEVIAGALHNDLEVPAMSLVPQLRERKEAMLEAGALGALICGSGPTLFGLARDHDHAREIAVSLEGVFPRVEVTRSAASGIEWLP